MKNELTIYTAAHKKVKEPPYSCYKLILVGSSNAKDSFGYLRDSDGDNISEKNPFWCELTGLYWMWKNAPKEKYIGLCHYRRFFSTRAHSTKPSEVIMNEEQIMHSIEGVDILLPKKLKKQKSNCLCKSDADLEMCREYNYLKECIIKTCPEYANALKNVFLSSEMCFGNIFVTSRELFDEYCEWLFPILFDIEKKMINNNDLRPREMGYLSEWLLNVWVEEKKLKVVYLPTIFTEEKKGIKLYIRIAKETLGL